jgi:putative phosphoribosyl transferase
MIPGREKERDGIERGLSINVGNMVLEGTLGLPRNPMGLVLFAHGSGSSRFSPRNRYVAEVLHSQAIATLLFDLLTREEEAIDERTAELRFNIGLLAERLSETTQSIMRNPDVKGLAVGYFGASTGAGAALMAAANLPGVISAIVSRGGRPDLAGDSLLSVKVPTLLIVGGNDEPVIALNRQALLKLKSPEKKLVIVPGATHLFEEPGTLEEVARLAADWFKRHLSRREQAHARS